MSYYPSVQLPLDVWFIYRINFFKAGSDYQLTIDAALNSKSVDCKILALSRLG